MEDIGVVAVKRTTAEMVKEYWETYNEIASDMEKISVSDLSIGDWVYVQFLDGDKLSGRIVSLSDTGGMEVSCSDTMDVRCTIHFIFPIHITAEVLEKNGFTHDKWSKKIWRYEDEESEAVYYIEGNKVEVTTDDCKINLVCKSVAELQHALRLAKAGKEIVL